MGIGNRSLRVEGQRFGRLTAVRRLRVEKRLWVWEFDCDCGNKFETPIARVTRGNTRSCGCLLREHVELGSITHGHVVGQRMTRTYRAWRAAKTRCFNPNWWAYDRYGGRGITMCDRWKGDFAAFLEDMGECPEGHSIERKDNNGNYEPGNCEWVPATDQHVSKTGVILVEWQGNKMNLAQYAKARGVTYSSLWSRVKGNWPNPHEAADAILSGKRVNTPTAPKAATLRQRSYRRAQKQQSK